MALAGNNDRRDPVPPDQGGTRRFDPLSLAAYVGAAIIAVALFLMIAKWGDFKWELVVVLVIGAALAGAGVFTEISATAQGFTIKTIAESLAKVNKAQIEAIDKVKTAVAATSEEISASRAKARPDVGGRPDEADSRTAASNTSLEYSRDVRANLRQAEEALQASLQAQEWLNGYLASLRGIGRP